MRNSVIVAAGSGILLVAVVVLGFTGVVLPSTDGAAQPNATTQALREINTAATALAEAPAATYSGRITQSVDDRSSENRSSETTVTDLTVTAAGTVSGTVQQRSGGSAQLIQLSDKTFVKGEESFWRNRERPKQPAGVSIATPSADKWVVVEKSFLGIDLRAALRPSRIGLTLSQQDTALGDTELTGAPTGPIGATPDRRIGTGNDPIDVSEVEVDEDDGGVPGARRFLAGEMTVGVDVDGNPVALRGPLGEGFGGDGIAEADLAIKALDADATRSTYTEIRDSLKDGDFGAWNVTIADPPGSLDCTPGASCVIGYTLTNSVPDLTRGTVTVELQSSFKKNNVEFNTCTTKQDIPVNAGARMSCQVPYGPSADVDALTRFRVDVNGALDPTFLTAAVEQGEQISGTPANWTPTSSKTTSEARRYHRQVAVAPSNYVFTQNDFAFDGRETDGTLLLVYGPGYQAHVDGPALAASWEGTEQLVAQARDAKRAAGDTPVRMVFAEPRAADAMRVTLDAKGVTGVEVVTVEPAVRA